MSESSSLHDFFSAQGGILDVRSPGEFEQGRIPGAINMPLFTNEERAEVGTLYKQTGQKAAIQLGLQFVGPKLADFGKLAEEYSKDGHLRVHCWRGGMRSASVASLFRSLGLRTVTLSGGYKAFRRWVLSCFEAPFNFCTIGGFTGTGKTAILSALNQLGEQTLDLEAIACHRGSSYGMIGMPKQPSTEQFENEIAMQLSRFDKSKPIWIEDESRLIGRCRIPEKILSQMHSGTLYMIERPMHERLEILQREYGNQDIQELILATQRLEKRLGRERAKETISRVNSGHLKEAMETVLKYYDSTYCFTLQRRNQVTHRLQGEGLSDLAWAQKLKSFPVLVT